MTIVEIENMNAAELKVKRAEAAQAVVGDPQLAQRYVQARLDATTRDEKLAEQGATITALQNALETAKKSAAETQVKWETDQVALKVSAEGAGKLAQQLAEANSDRMAAVALAKNRRKVLGDITALIAPLLAAE